VHRDRLDALAEALLREETLDEAQMRVVTDLEHQSESIIAAMR
jgi:hypothetical protein